MSSPFPNTTIGKMIQPSGIQRCQNVSYAWKAQIYLECGMCTDSIAILPDRKCGIDPNAICDAITNEQAEKYFREHGWTIFDGNGQKTRCPRCFAADNSKEGGQQG